MNSAHKYVVNQTCHKNYFGYFFLIIPRINGIKSDDNNIIVIEVHARTKELKIENVFAYVLLKANVVSHIAFFMYLFP